MAKALNLVLGDAGGIRDIMVAVMNPEGQYLQFTTLGGGFTDAQRVEMLQTLEPMAAYSRRQDHMEDQQGAVWRIPCLRIPLHRFLCRP